ncbi:hypothetical protein GLOTRDRAFT_95863 [Gloeophyllum trabeum ATCC 11539]|uniref:WW domain-containing protein n=1 Tax=Gloeophyllum trabeum (strain ATCC 11539 / FP-39264 / Madison 617) TaxID=670483 RepID=S7PXI3_GLOTA|nr:uncharacterized protein GLOTRDRAFT_95863 [Gloeophyllum trabeum ATCC 11539]EPQ52228.1 hypothetical protein GLOTRDRAFT_95863 [Gloeophyllum trabeum ATCC 11539]
MQSTQTCKDLYLSTTDTIVAGSPSLTRISARMSRSFSKERYLRAVCMRRKGPEGGGGDKIGQAYTVTKPSHPDSIYCDGVSRFVCGSAVPHVSVTKPTSNLPGEPFGITQDVVPCLSNITEEPLPFLREAVRLALRDAPNLEPSSPSHLTPHYHSREASKAPSRTSSRPPSPPGSASGMPLGGDTRARLRSRSGTPVRSRANSPYRREPPSPTNPGVMPSPAASAVELREISPPPNDPTRLVAAPGSSHTVVNPKPKPICPSNIARYERHHSREKTDICVRVRDDPKTTLSLFHETTDSINSLPSHPSSEEMYDVPKDWKACEHPEGALYFMHEKKRIFTDAYLCDEEIRPIICNSVTAIESMMEWDPSSELVLELLKDGTCGYYFADLEKKTLFWAEETWATQSMFEEIEGETWPSHLSRQFITFLRYYAKESSQDTSCNLGIGERVRMLDVTLDIYNEVLAELTHGTIDSLTASYSTFPWGHEDGQKMIKLVEGLKDLGMCGGRPAGVVGRIMSVLVHQKYLHYHGQRAARLALDQSIYDKEDHHRSWGFRILSPLLFNEPRMQLQQLEKIWTDRISHSVHWRRTIDKLQEGWEKLSLTTTVMLTVDVSFLAIQSVDVGFNKPSFRCAAQIAIYLSTVASAGSIILGLLLNRHHRVMSRNDAEVAQRYMWSKRHPSRGLETLAIMYSLPYALLMWAIVHFMLFDQSYGLVAWFLHTDWNGDNHPGLDRVAGWAHIWPKQDGCEESKIRQFFRRMLARRPGVVQDNGSSPVAV